LPTVAEIEAHREAQLLERVTTWLNRGRLGQERALLTNLVEAGHDPMEIAAAALRLVRVDKGQRPILPLTEVQEQRYRRDVRDVRETRPNDRKPRQHRAAGVPEAGMVSLTLSKGKLQGVRPGDVVGTIAFHADIPGSIIGKIHIQDHHTVVDVPEQFVAKVLAKSSDFRINSQSFTVERM